MRNFKAFITLNVPQKCSVKYYTNAEMLKISKKIVRSVEYSPRPENVGSPTLNRDNKEKTWTFSKSFLIK